MAVEEYSNHVGLLAPSPLIIFCDLKEHGIKLAVATGLTGKALYSMLKEQFYFRII
mgnify:CR=1 FL=1